LAVSLPAATATERVTLRDSRERAERSLSDYSGVVVWLERPADPAQLSVQRVKMLQKDKTFEPHVLAITLGTTVDFPNLALSFTRRCLHTVHETVPVLTSPSVA
jgi:hypothetical protein